MTTTFATTAPTDTRNAPTMRTLTFGRAQGPLVVDVWEPPVPDATITPVLLVHGWGGTGSYWHDTAAALARTARVIVPDLPGTGRSQPVQSAQRLRDQVATLVELLDLLDLERVQVVGHSMGGAMAVLLADERPQAVERLILTSLTFFMTEAQVRVYRMVMRMFKVTMPLRQPWLADIPGMAQMMAQHYFYRVPKDKDILRDGLRDFLNLDAATAKACADDAPDPIIYEAGARLQAPTLLIACRHDQMMPLENVDFTVETIPDCRVHWVEECGHLPMVEKPDEYLSIVQDFLHL